MKKFAIFMMLIITTLCCVFAFSACEDNDVSELVMDKRYIREDDAKKESQQQSSYVFHSDGTGEYTFHYDGYNDYDHEHYKITFKYTYADGDKSAVVCFYDSAEALEGNYDGGYGLGYLTKWSRVLLVSKNVLVLGGTEVWINEDYLKTIPNFGKQPA